MQVNRKIRNLKEMIGLGGKCSEMDNMPCDECPIGNSPCSGQCFYVFIKEKAIRELTRIEIDLAFEEKILK